MEHHFDYRTIRQLLLFAVTTEEKSIRKAAQKLGMSVPPLALQLDELEATLKMKLLRRTPRGVTLTSVGRAALPLVENFLGHAEALFYSLNQMKEKSSAVIPIGSNSEAMMFWLPDFKRKLSAILPNVELFTKEVDSRDIEPELLEGTISIGIGFLGYLSDKRLKIIQIKQEKPIVVLPKDHHLQAKKEIFVKDLRNEDFVLHQRAVAPVLFDALVSMCRDVAGFTPKICHEVRSSSRQIAYVSCGQGIALLPESFAQWMPSNVRARSIKDAPECVRLTLAWNPMVDSSVRDKVISLVTN